MTQSSLPTRPRVLVADAEYAPSLPEAAARFPDLDLVGVDAQHPLESLADSSVAGILAQNARVDVSLLDRLDGLRAVLKVGRNYLNIDADAVRARGLTFACVPRKGPNCVAELAITLILALSKDLLISHESVAEGAYRLRGMRPEPTAERKIAFHWMRHTRLHEVRGKTLGIIGMGEIGCELARRASVMDMRVLYHKRTPLTSELEERFDAAYRDLPALLRESDYVCLAVPHTPDTEGMIGADELAMMKPDAYLVNICRGGVVDEAALIAALASQRIAGAGLDVFIYEPLPADSPLCRLHNVILTPHVGGGTGTSRILELNEALEEMQRVLAGERPRLRV
jgi:phosphogluconate 2-dehydrogenase